MPMENQLAHAITQTEYDLSYDKAAKKLLANKQILAQIMKNCVPAVGGMAFIGAAKPDLTCFSFRAFRFAKRCPAL